MSQDSPLLERLKTRLSQILRRIDGGGSLNLAALAAAVGFMFIMLAMLFVVAFSGHIANVPELAATIADVRTQDVIRTDSKSGDERSKRIDQLLGSDETTEPTSETRDAPSDARELLIFNADFNTEIQNLDKLLWVMNHRAEAMHIDLSTLDDDNHRSALSDGIVVWESKASRRRYGYWPSGRMKFIANESLYVETWRWNGWAHFYSKSGEYTLRISDVDERDKRRYFYAKVFDVISDSPLWSLSIEDDGSIGIFERLDATGKCVEAFHYRGPMGALKQGKLPREIDEMHEAAMPLFNRAI